MSKNGFDGIARAVTYQDGLSEINLDVLPWDKSQSGVSTKQADKQHEIVNKKASLGIYKYVYNKLLTSKPQTLNRYERVIDIPLIYVIPSNLYSSPWKYCTVRSQT